MFVKGSLAKCATDSFDCSFIYDELLTPVARSFSSQITGNDVVFTISGTGFSTNKNDNLVLIGNERCDVSSSTVTQIICKLVSDQRVGGTVALTLIVVNKGRALSNLHFTDSMSNFISKSYCY